MRAKITLLLPLIITWYTAVCQKKNLDFIISVDEKIAIGTIFNLHINASMNDGGTKRIDAQYYPGNLSIDKNDYDGLLSDSVKTVTLSFQFNDFKGDRSSKEYEVNLQKGFLKNYFFILYIYNLDKKKYKDTFAQTAAKYVYEYDYPGGSARLIRKPISLGSHKRPGCRP